MENQTDNIIIEALQDKIEVSVKDVRLMSLSENNLIDIFITSIISLKSNASKVVFDNHSHNFKMEIHSFMLIGSLKLFIDKYCEITKNNELKLSLFNLLNINSSDLYFNTIAVDFENEREQLAFNDILDALCVKYYQSVMLYIKKYFENKDMILDVTADEKTNSYIFNYRMMNIMEISAKASKLNQQN